MPPDPPSPSKKSCQLLGRNPDTPRRCTSSRVGTSPPLPEACDNKALITRTSAFTSSTDANCADPTAAPLSTLLIRPTLAALTPTTPAAAKSATGTDAVLASAAARMAAK